MYCSSINGTLKKLLDHNFPSTTDQTFDWNWYVSDVWRRHGEGTQAGAVGVQPRLQGHAQEEHASPRNDLPAWVRYHLQMHAKVE